jgi:hypothetical protein
MRIGRDILMPMKYTTKRFVLLLILIGIGIAFAYAQGTKPSAAPQLPGISNPGRYQIVMNGGIHNFLLDTQTGGTWQFSSFSDLEGNPTAWIVQPRLDSEQELAIWARAHVAKKQP